MAGHADELESRGIGVLVIGFDELEALDDMKQRLSSPFTFLRDESRAGYIALGLGRAGVLRTYLHPDVLRPYARFALQRELPKLRRRQDRRQLGGDFVVRRDGQVVFAHPERGPEDRVPVGAIVAAARSAAKPET
ncbi:MAG: hypothetical protein M3N53_12980 [Actinomycetota bacterium]|nr:hypothetical protein [Actinomycetota bacterium]